jgi:histidine ammonia-lyase
MIQHKDTKEIPSHIIITGEALTEAEIIAVARQNAPISLHKDAIQHMRSARTVIDRIAAEGKVVYGVTTGFGHLSSVHIAYEQLETLQHNLLRSHSSGVGEPLSEEVARAMTLLLAASLARGHSGVRVDVVQLLIDMLNAHIYPLIPSRGSVGASGDLAPLAHLGLLLIGEGEAIYRGERCTGGEALQRAELVPLHLQAKEGLALINGTHLMEAIAILALADARSLIQTAEVACAMSLEGLMGSHVPLDERIHVRRGQYGQQESAAHLRMLVRDSDINRSHANCARVQDPYTLRCAPQVFGAVRDAFDYCAGVFERELGAVTDNPLIFADDDAVLSGGNFHGQPLALALDTLAIALTQLASFSERRIFNLMGPHEWDLESGAPLFLTPNPGLNSGYMITQYVAAALVNEIKILAHPASIDSIPTSANMEDFVSMGVTSAHKLLSIIERTQQVVAIEMLCAAQMLGFRHSKPGLGVQMAYEHVRYYVPALENDRSLSPDIALLTEVVRRGEFAHIA